MYCVDHFFLRTIPSALQDGTGHSGSRIGLVLAQFEALDLAGCGLGQFVYKGEPPGVFVAGQAVLAVFQQIVCQ